MLKFTPILRALGALCLLALAACSTTTPDTLSSFPVSAVPPSEVQPGDLLQVTFLYWPELNPAEQAVRPDGKISLQLVGDVEVAGLTPNEVRTKLLALYADKLIDPEVNVVVNSFESHRVFVAGEVQSPGPIQMTGRLSALEAIMQSGGAIKQSAKMDRVVVVRQHDNRQYARTVDLQAALENPESEPFLLEPYDVVFVPRTAIDRADQWVEQYVNQLIPRSVHYNFTHEVHRDGGNSSSNSALDVVSAVGAAANF